jgi:hypothetical protein
MMSTEVTYEAGELTQTESERVTYTVDLSPLTAAPTNPEVHQVIDETSGGDVTATVMPNNACTLTGAAGTTMVLPLLRNLTDGHDYRIEGRFRGENAAFREFHLRVKCRGTAQDPELHTIGDDFTGTDTDLLDQRTATPDEDFSWEVFQGNGSGVSISGNALVSTGNSNTSVFRANQDLGSADHSVQFTLKSWDEGSGRFNIGVVARKNSEDTQTYYWAEARADNGTDSIHLFKSVEGSATELDSASVTFTADDVIKLVVRESSLRVYQNTTEVISVSDTAITHGNFCGIFRNANDTSPTVTIDDWSATSES